MLDKLAIILLLFTDSINSHVSSCFTNPSQSKCKDISPIYTKLMVNTDIDSVCNSKDKNGKEMSYLSGCIIKDACSTTPVGAMGAACEPWTLLADICSPRGGASMKDMMGCHHYTQLCLNTSTVVEQCSASVTSSLVLYEDARTDTISMCSSMGSNMDGCVDCKTTETCARPLESLSKVCLNNGYGKCEQWNNMCAAAIPCSSCSSNLPIFCVLPAPAPVDFTTYQIIGVIVSFIAIIVGLKLSKKIILRNLAIFSIFSAFFYVALGISIVLPDSSNGALIPIVLLPDFCISIAIIQTYYCNKRCSESFAWFSAIFFAVAGSCAVYLANIFMNMDNYVALPIWLNINGILCLVSSITTLDLYYTWNTFGNSMHSVKPNTESAPLLNESFETKVTINEFDPLKDEQWNVPPDRLQVGERIGAGGCGWIYKGTLGGSAAAVPIACKEVVSATINPKDLLEFEHEARIISQLHHPFVLTFYGICKKTVTEYNGELGQRLYMVTELATGGSLESRIQAVCASRDNVKVSHLSYAAKKQNREDTETLTISGLQSVEWALQIAAGMSHIHERGFIHRDLKPQNILLNSKDQCLICDFGTVKKIKKSRWSGSKEMPIVPPVAIAGATIGMTQEIGTPMYLAPEQGLKKEYTSAVDVWSFGVTLVRLFSLKYPYPSSLFAHKLIMAVAMGGLRPLEIPIEDLPHPDVYEIIEGCLQYNASERYTFPILEMKLSKIYNSMVAKEKSDSKICLPDGETKNEEMKTKYTALDGTVFTLPSVK